MVCVKFVVVEVMLNPLSANVEYIPHDGDFTWSRYGASYRQNH